MARADDDSWDLVVSAEDEPSAFADNYYCTAVLHIQTAAH